MSLFETRLHSQASPGAARGVAVRYLLTDAPVARDFGHHPGTLDPTHLPATQADAERLWAWAQAACLPHFEPYEDAMSARSTTLFHTRVSALMNLHRLLPRRVVEDALALDLSPRALADWFWVAYSDAWGHS